MKLITILLIFITKKKHINKRINYVCILLCFQFNDEGHEKYNLS